MPSCASLNSASSGAMSPMETVIRLVQSLYMVLAKAMGHLFFRRMASPGFGRRTITDSVQAFGVWALTHMIFMRSWMVDWSASGSAFSSSLGRPSGPGVYFVRGGGYTSGGDTSFVGDAIHGRYR